MRIRDNSVSRSSPTSHRWYRKSTNEQTGAVDSAITWMDTDVMQDAVVPRFKQRSRKGEIFINFMTKHTETTKVLARSWRSEGKLGYHLGSNGELPPNFIIGAEYDNIAHLEALAITEAYANVGSPDVATLTELVELKETLSFLYSPVKAMVSLTRRAHRYVQQYNRWEQAFKKRLDAWDRLTPLGKKKYPKPVPGNPPTLQMGGYRVSDIASLWLAYRYAIMPLVYTFQDIQKLLVSIGEGDKPTRATARAKSKDERVVESSNVTSEGIKNDTGWGALQYETWNLVSVKTSCRAGVLYAPDWSLSALTGFQINRVPAALYEGIPLSFVSDWFHNGSEVYDALTAEFRALKIHGAWVVTKVEYLVQRDDEIRPLPGTVYTGVVGGERTLSGQRSGTWKRRRAASLADVKFKLRIELNTKRIVDGLALVTTMLDAALGKKRRK